ncbi:MAG: M23 family metallopeptidase [Clostridia bacterium]|nr:M23 family metallopeptidase [Clostridia bacterium]
MKNITSGIPCRKNSAVNLQKYRILPLLAIVAAVAILSSCTVTISMDEPITIDVSSVDNGYNVHIISGGLSVTQDETTAAQTEQTTVTQEATTAQTAQTTATQATDVTVRQPEFRMPFDDKSHGGIDYKMTQGFSSSHGGMDFAVYYGNPILASADGVVTTAYNDGDLPKNNASDLRWTYGTYVVVTHSGGYQTYYAHLSRRAVNVGDTVVAGQVIGYSGNTGRVSSTQTGKYAGTHLHFEIRVMQDGQYIRTDPSAYLPWYK